MLTILTTRPLRKTGFVLPDGRRDETTPPRTVTDPRAWRETFADDLRTAALYHRRRLERRQG